MEVSGRRQHGERQVFRAMPAIEGIVTSSGNHSSGKLMAAAAGRLRQLRKLGMPAEVDGVMIPKIPSGSPCRGSHSRNNRQSHREKQQQEQNVAKRPMEPINSRKHSRL